MGLPGAQVSQTRKVAVPGEIRAGFLVLEAGGACLTCGCLVLLQLEDEHRRRCDERDLSLEPIVKLTGTP